MPAPAIPPAAAPDPQEEDQASAILRQALVQRRDALASASGLPVDDKALTERILGEARRRSETISLKHQAGSSTRRSAEGPGIPWWVHVAWFIAVAGVIAAWFYL